jgi:1,4-dihydroxy-6-naphthoate synthase
VLYDVETLNDLAFDEDLDITKLSFYAWLKVKNRYKLLNNGAAMGFGCGPVVIARPNCKPAELNHSRIVLPGQWTTAHLLFRLWSPDADRRQFVPYDRIFQMLRSEEADFGVIIHESRFTFESEGFVQIVDLGSWWEEETGLPIPLGGIAAKKGLGEDLIKQIDATVKKSIERANTCPEKTFPYIRQHAQEMDETVLQSHIQTFVNEFSLDLPEKGHLAIAALEKMAKKAGVL